jgi:hypothetical protein
MSKSHVSMALLSSVLCVSAADQQQGWEENTISPVVNPLFFEAPQIRSEVRPLFAWHTFDDDFLGTDVNVRVYAIQLRYAVNDRLAIIATKDGYIEVDPKHGKDTHGWADIGAGVKYALYRNDEKQLIITPGLTFEIPSGSDDVFQGNGDGEFNLFVSAVKGWGNLHATVNLGGRIPIDMDEETAKIRYCGMLDYYVCQYFIPFVSINAFTTVSEGEAFPADTEGYDLINFGSTDASGQTQAAAGLGFRSRVHKNVDLGFAYENGFTPDDDLFRDRFTVDLIWRF